MKYNKWVSCLIYLSWEKVKLFLSVVLGVATHLGKICLSRDTNSI